MRIFRIWPPTSAARARQPPVAKAEARTAVDTPVITQTAGNSHSLLLAGKDFGVRGHAPVLLDWASIGATCRAQFEQTGVSGVMSPQFGLTPSCGKACLQTGPGLREQAGRREGGAQ